MDVREYLHWVRSPYAIFTTESRPPELDCVFRLYDDMLYHYDLELENPLNLVLTQSRSEFSTQFIMTDSPYIVLEMQEIQRISQVMEYFALHEIDLDVPISHFHALWIEHHQQYEFIGQMDVGDGKPTRLSILTTDKLRLAHRSPLFQKLSESALLEPFCKLEGFQAAFEIIPAFAIAHEIAHFEYGRATSDDKTAVFEFVDGLPTKHRGGGYFLDLIRPEGLLLSPHLNEELYCDFSAILTAYRLCVGRHWIDERLFCVALVQMFNAIFFHLMLQGCVDKNRYDELRIRKGFGLLLALDCLENESKARDLYTDYERFLGLLDLYCVSLCVTLRVRPESFSAIAELPDH